LKLLSATIKPDRAPMNIAANHMSIPRAPISIPRLHGVRYESDCSRIVSGVSLLNNHRGLRSVSQIASGISTRKDTTLRGTVWPAECCVSIILRTHSPAMSCGASTFHTEEHTSTKQTLGTVCAIEAIPGDPTIVLCARGTHEAIGL
jgi:hypothetical protein